MPLLASPKEILTVEDNAIVTAEVRESHDFSLRCLVESMLRDGADEQAVVRAVRAAAISDEGVTRSPIRRRGLQQLLRAATRRRDRTAA